MELLNSDEEGRMSESEAAVKAGIDDTLFLSTFAVLKGLARDKWPEVNEQMSAMGAPAVAASVASGGKGKGRGPPARGGKGKGPPARGGGGAQKTGHIQVDRYWPEKSQVLQLPGSFCHACVLFRP